MAPELSRVREAIRTEKQRRPVRIAAGQKPHRPSSARALGLRACGVILRKRSQATRYAGGLEKVVTDFSTLLLLP
jgi:hypothetical protein